MIIGYDVRGKDITKDKAYDIGRRLGSLYDTLAVGHDNRRASARIIDAFLDGLTDSGCDVHFLGMVPTPVINYYGWKNMPAVSVTASHNPIGYTGFKLVSEFGSTLPIWHKVLKAKLRSGHGTVKKVNVVTNYIRYVTEGLRSKKKVVVETFSGVVTPIVSKALKRIGCKVRLVHSTIKPDYGGINPLPEGKNIKHLIRARGDFKVALDGDADRATFITDRVLNSSEVARAFVKQFEYTKVVASRDVDIRAKHVNIGRVYVERYMVKGYRFGVEGSGHYYFGDYYPFSDGVLATLLFTQINGQIPTIPIVRTSIPCKTKLRDEFKCTKDGWVMLHRSKTEDKLRVTVRAKTLKQAVEEANKIKKKMRRKC